MKRLCLLLLVAGLTLGLAVGAYAEVKKAKGSIELSDPAGDVNKINTSGGTYPGMDVVKLKISSDGKQLVFETTLKDPPPDFASNVLIVWFDVDNSPKTGIQLMFYKDRVGFEYRSQLYACIKYDNGMTACTGGSSKTKVLERFGALDLDYFKGKDENARKSLVGTLRFPGQKPALKTPITGKTVKGVLDYADLKVKSGQTIRILVREACGPIKATSLFPEVLLTLK